jgi:hypothetical protein
MEHPNVKLEIEMAWDPQVEGYMPHTAGLADDSLYRGKIAFDECVDAINFLADFLASHNLLGPSDHPDDMNVVSAASEQLLLEALCQVHSRWDIPMPGMEEDEEEEEEDEEDGEEEV